MVYARADKQGTDFAVHAVIDRCQDLNLANPVMDLLLP